MDDLDDITVDAAIRTIRRLREERDEARRMYCEEVEHHHDTTWNDGERDFKPLPALDVAKQNGWDYSGDTPPTTVPAEETAKGFFQLDRKQLETDRLKGEVRKLQNQVEDYRRCFADLAKNRDELWDDLERVTVERDAARSTAAYLWARSAGGDERAALREFYASKGWSLPQEKRHE